MHAYDDRGSLYHMTAYTRSVIDSDGAIIRAHVELRSQSG
jgi:hypothetical protein